MEQNNLEQLKKLAKVFNTDNVITSAEIEQVLTGIMSIMASFRKENIQLTEEYKTIISDTLAHIEKISQDADNNLSTKSSALLGQIDAKLALVNDTLTKVKKIKAVPGKNGINGKDADEELIVGKVLEQIKLPENKVLTGEEIKTELEKLDGDNRLDIKAIKGAEKLTTQANLDRAVSILDQRTQFLINKRSGGSASAFTDLTDVPSSYSGQSGKVVTVKGTEDGLEFTTVGGTGTVTSIATAGLISGGTITTTGTITTSMATNKLVGRGTAGTGVMEEITLGTGLSFTGTTLNATAAITGSDTQVLFFDGANNPAGEAGLTYNKTTDELTVAGSVLTPEVKATSSAGVDIHNNSGTQVALFGAGGGTGSSLVGTTNIGSASADYIQVAGGTGASTFTATGSSTDIDITAVPKGAGKFKVTGNANISGLTASEIVITDASKNLVSAAVATYPSLTELTYVKGVTSAIQTQINNKLTTSTAASTYIPYTGATANVDLGTHTLTAKELNVNTNGDNALFSTYGFNGFGDKNLWIGGGGQSSTVSAIKNVSLGSNSLFSNTDGSSNTAIGVESLYNNTTGLSNMAIGKASLYANTTGRFNLAVGTGALYENTSGRFNIGIGTSALETNEAGYYNVAIGGSDTGFGGYGDYFGNTLIGYAVGGSFIAGTYDYNTAIGYLSGTSMTGDRNLFLGAYSGAYETGSDSFYINNQDRTNTAGDKSGSLLYGTFNATPANQTLVINAKTTISNYLLNQVLVVPKSTTPVTVNSTDSNTYYTNEGATALGVFNLPTAVAGYVYTFIVQDADGIKVVANTGDTIRGAGVVSASAGYATSTIIGDTITLVAINATEWIATSLIGSWSII